MMELRHAVHMSVGEYIVHERGILRLWMTKLLVHAYVYLRWIDLIILCH
jgi:hypothetical protein